MLSVTRHSTHVRLTQPAHTVERHVGRLLEIRLRGPVRTTQEITAISNAVHSEIEKAAGTKLVVISDYRAATVFSPERFEDWQAIVRSATPHVERSALLFEKSNATFNLQLQRVVLRIGSSFRKMFYEVDEAKKWLEGALDAPEYVRLVGFLHESSR